MAFEPDIVVFAGDGTDLVLVAETKGSRTPPAALREAEEQLKRYMIGMRCSLGLLITPKTLRILRDSYRGYTPNSIELIGDFEFPAGREAEAEPGLDAGARFESFVQRWLEGLKDQSARDALPLPLREAVDQHLLPVLRIGDIRAAHHRPLLSRASEPGRSR